MVTSASANGSDGRSNLSISPRASVSAKGNPAAIVKTFAVIPSGRREIGEERLGVLDDIGRSHMHPDTVQPQAEKAFLFDGAIPKQVHGKLALWGILEDSRMHDLHTGIGKGRNL